MIEICLLAFGAVLLLGSIGAFFLYIPFLPIAVVVVILLGMNPDLFDRRMGGKYSNPEAASPEALFATDTSCWTGFCRPEYRVSQYPLIPCAEPRPLYGRRENSKSAAPLQLFRSIDRL
jgi:hypothetical protein